ncbi:MAG: efflux RND transporter periplasmic adaptor subunit [Planctomycetaceae bacterium]|nr:efflux RND transporter periplasmic adaptor subunit [Planctomycetaceae bacterium]
MFSPKLIVQSFCVVVVGCVVLACVNSGGSRPGSLNTPVDAAPLNDPPVLPSVPAEPPPAEQEQEQESEQIEGFTEPWKDIHVAAAEMGTLQSVQVKDGQQVTQGQLLARLNDDVLKVSLEVASAGMSATGELETARTQLELKQVELEKLQELFEREHASQQELDRVSGELRVAESRLMTVREDLDIRRLEHARIQAQLKQREIRSTIDGVIVEVKKEEGEFVSPSDPVVARVVQLDPLRVVFSVPNERRGDVKNGQTVMMRIAGGGVPIGTVEHVSPVADASSGTFQVNVRLPNPDGQWHGGEKSELLLDVETDDAP